MRSKKPFSAGKPTFVMFMALLLASAIAPTPAQARKFKVLHTFHGPDGAGPFGELVRDDAGNLYGTTGAGGVGKCQSGFDDRCGTAYKLDKNGKQVWLHSFNGKSGLDPMAGVLRDKEGNLYGTAVLGGDTKCFRLGCGTVFKLDANGIEKLLHKFTGTPDGWFPVAPLTRDAAENLYGTTQNGGSAGGFGTVFRVDNSGKETVLYSFAGGTDGSDPSGGLIKDKKGNLYGVTFDGGGSGCSFGCGTVFKLDTGGNETILYGFQGGSDGEGPTGQLVMDDPGNLYGTTVQGGNGGCSVGLGCGTIFELDTNGIEIVLYRFSGGTDGQYPHAGLVRDKAGNLYGTTIFGGSPTCHTGDCGVVFKLSAAGKETVLHAFTGGSDGWEPFGGLIRDSTGNLYGTTQTGGDTNCFPPDGCGVVFKLTP
jgi:uncharacterized repeat protein (TIGR03803 family)